MFGISTIISFNSFMKGGNTRKTEVRNIKVRKINTKKSEIDLGIFKKFFNLLVRLQIMLAITREQIMRRRKSLRLQKIRKQIIKTNILKKTELLNFY